MSVPPIRISTVTPTQQLLTKGIMKNLHFTAEKLEYTFVIGLTIGIKDGVSVNLDLGTYSLSARYERKR
jgi:hypothetical protein